RGDRRPSLDPGGAENGATRRLAPAAARRTSRQSLLAGRSSPRAGQCANGRCRIHVPPTARRGPGCPRPIRSAIAWPASRPSFEKSTDGRIVARCASGSEASSQQHPHEYSLNRLHENAKTSLRETKMPASEHVATDCPNSSYEAGFPE